MDSKLKKTLGVVVVAFTTVMASGAAAAALPRIGG